MTGTDDRIYPLGAEAYTISGTIAGHVVDTLIDDEGRAAFLELRTGLLDPRGLVLVPVAGAVHSGRMIILLATDDDVAHAPRSAHPTQLEEGELEQTVAYWNARTLYGTEQVPATAPLT